MKEKEFIYTFYKYHLMTSPIIVCPTKQIIMHKIND